MTQTLTFTYQINPDQSGQTVSTFLKTKGYSRHLIAQLKTIPTGIQVNQKQVTTRYPLKTGELLTTTIIEETGSDHILPVPVPLDILYEDRDLLVLSKQADTPTHPSQNNHDNTLANGLAYYFREKRQPFSCRIINRLDRNTTGLLLVAKHRLSACMLSRMVKERRIHREYLALAEGEMPPHGSICAPIARAPGSVIMRCVDQQQGAYALTHYHTLGYDARSHLSVVRLWLETGRTHQIRVHLQHIGHPIPGDFLYHPANRQNRTPAADHNIRKHSILAGHPTSSQTQNTIPCRQKFHMEVTCSLPPDLIKRQALHSWRLSFPHPITGKILTFCAPVPDDMARLIPAQLLKETLMETEQKPPGVF